jgi:hypothetical protein
MTAGMVLVIVINLTPGSGVTTLRLGHVAHGQGQGVLAARRVHAVAVRVYLFLRKYFETGFFHFTGSRVEARRLSSYGSTGFQLVQPHHARAHQQRSPLAVAPPARGVRAGLVDTTLITSCYSVDDSQSM